MKKKISILILVLACILVLCACGCEHEWIEPDCVNPATCSKCGETEGESMGHIWMAATCTEPKTCEVCGTAEGEPKGHSWVEASCEEAKHCEACGETEGEPLGHTWVEATTEAPQTCSTCSATEGERIVTDERFTTAANADLFGKWACQLELTGEMMELPEFEGTVAIDLILDFGNAGDLAMSAALADEEAFLDAIISMSIEETYAEFEAEGISREDADVAIEATYGMTLEEYLRSAFEGVSMNDMLTSVYDAMNLGGVYYVADGQLYVGDSWDDAMEPSGYAVNGDSLTIDSFSEEMGVELVFSRVYG